jgi:hypothetical protein
VSSSHILTNFFKYETVIFEIRLDVFDAHLQQEHYQATIQKTRPSFENCPLHADADLSTGPRAGARSPRDFRRLYWVAGACNALAGTLQYHLMTFAQARTPTQQAKTGTLVQKWLRVIRRADASWRAG